MSRGDRYDTSYDVSDAYMSSPYSCVSVQQQEHNGLISDIGEYDATAQQCTSASIADYHCNIPISTLGPDRSRVRKGNNTLVYGSGQCHLSEGMTTGTREDTYVHYGVSNSLHCPVTAMTLRQSIAAIATEQQERIGSTVSPILVSSDAGGNTINDANCSTSNISVNPSTVGFEVPFLLGHKPQQVKTLIFNLLSNWGNSHFVGIAGVEIFDGQWCRIVPHVPTPERTEAPFTVHCSFDDIISGKSENSFSEWTGNFLGGLRKSYISNAKSISNVANIVSCGDFGQPNKRGVTDLNEMFQIPIITPCLKTLHTDDKNGTCSSIATRNHSMFWINFKDPIDISLIRIFNYNAGRTHVSKGVRLMEIMTDSEQLLFRGEIREADGTTLSEPESILFANDDEMEALSISAVEQNYGDMAQENVKSACHVNMKSNLNLSEEGPFSPFDPSVRFENKLLPPTSKDICQKSVSFLPSVIPQNNAHTLGDKISGKIPHSVDLCVRDVTGLCIEILSTWGDVHFVGLSGIRFFTSKGTRLFGVCRISLARPVHDFDAYEFPDEAAIYFREFDHEVSALMDDDPTTACVWRYQSGMQIRVLFDGPVLDGIGFVDIANYGIEDSTHTGAKHVNLYLSTERNSSILESSFNQIYDTDKANLSKHGIHMLTAECPLVLRKCPNQLSILKFQSFDISMDHYDTFGGPSSSLLTSSMVASLLIRNRVEMKRACMMLQAPESCDLTHTPHVTVVDSCILPLGYVFKLELGVLVAVSNRYCGNGVGDGCSVIDVGNELKTVLKSIINEGINNNAEAKDGVSLYDCDGKLIDSEIYYPGVSLVLQESSCGFGSLSNSSDLVSSGHPDSSDPDIDSMILSGPSRADSHGMGMLLMGSSKIGRSVSHVSNIRIRQQKATSYDLLGTSCESSQGKLGGDTKYSTSEVKGYAKADISLIFVFDVLTAISAISYRFSELMGKPQQKNNLYVTTTSLRVLVDDTVVYQSLDKDNTMWIGGDVNECSDPLVKEIEIPRCVAFTYDIPFVNKIAEECF